MALLTRANLRPYQNRIAGFIKDHEFCAVFADPGLGKTVSTLTAYADLLNTLDASRALVVAPLRVASKVWTDEIDKWEHVSSLTTSKIIGELPTRWQNLKTSADLHLVNREQMPWLEAQFIQNKKQVRKFPWDTIIVDESQSFKHQSSQRWKSLKRLRRLCQRMVLLTGTPISNGYGDLWAQFYLLDQGRRLGATEDAFRDRWFDPERNEENYTNWILKKSAEQDIQRQIADITVSLRAEDYLDLPPVQYNVVSVELSDHLLQQYKKFERECILHTPEHKITARNAGAIAGKLLQYSNGAIYHDDKGNWTHIHDAKIDALLELVDLRQGPILLAYGFRHDLQRIQAALAKVKVRVGVLRSDASFDQWNRGEFDVGLIHPASAGHGLNLQGSGSEMIIWFGLTADLDWYQQLNARLTGGIRREGRNIVVHHILCDRTRDLAIMDLLGRKDGTQEGLKIALSV